MSEKNVKRTQDENRGGGYAMKYHYDGAISHDIYGHDRTEHKVILRFVKLLDVIAVGIPFIGIWLGYYSQKMAIPYYRMGNVLIIVLYYILLARRGLFTRSRMDRTSQAKELIA